VLATTFGTLLLNGLLVLWLWAAGVEFATMDRVQPGESGFHIGPLPSMHKVLLIIILITNAWLLIYLIVRRKRQYALSFAAGAAVPMGYVLYILASA
jgi:hypothetical protein